ncbi:hypothetical protein E4P82_04840 [Candidatus Competibacter phosphatis]|uniref:DUF1579 domain-containing protein n=1 Tax=Candidatus Competibacter phosphatis TaxID=221280 RepID=A0ABX1TGT8_9GAMM|nr:hypothetical protein [Candidatus Competibacter phosphatis]NMQ18583.1 hypothetical protein [Candidatus Competibacter phosphatis]
MPRKKRQPSAKLPEASSDALVKVPWYRRAWFLITLIGAGIYGLLANGPTLLSNAEKLPSEFERVSGKFLSWYYKDQAWTGLWSANPEGYVDTEDMKLSDVDIKLHLIAEHGWIDGEISMKSICNVVPMFDYLLLEGKVGGDIATITAFDFIGGERKNFFRFTAKRDGVVITVSPKEGAQGWLPSAPARVGLHPLLDGENPYNQLTGTCRVEKEELMKKIRPKGLVR